MATQTHQGIKEDIEGIDEEVYASWGDYPIDELFIRTASRSIYEVLRRIKQDKYIMDPDFQRDFIWPKKMQSKLIESVIMRIPLPVFYLAENSEGKMIVVDGLQRLTTFYRFWDNQFRLELPNRPNDLHGKRFKDLDSKLQNRFEDFNLTIYSIDADVPEQARLDIFDRVNSGIPLTKQQMRNCLYMGKATLFLRDKSKTDLFLKATGNSLRTDNMRDREFINRFCSFQILDVEEYRNMDDFLANGLKMMNDKSEQLLEPLSKQLELTLYNNLKMFGKHTFRKHDRGQQDRNVLNASLWDVMSTGLSRYNLSTVQEREGLFKDEFYSLMKNEEFQDSITNSPNTPKQVRNRFRLAKDMLRGVFGAYQN